MPAPFCTSITGQWRTEAQRIEIEPPLSSLEEITCFEKLTSRYTHSVNRNFTAYSCYLVHLHQQYNKFHKNKGAKTKKRTKQESNTSD